MILAIILTIEFFFGNRIAAYKAVYPTVGTLADVVAAIDQVGTVALKSTSVRSKKIYLYILLS